MGFIHIGITDIIDIFAVAILMYYLYRVAKKSNALNILGGLIVIFIVWELTRAMNMELLSSILGSVLGVGVIALIVVFQPEIRQFLQSIGVSRNKRGGGFLRKLFNLNRSEQQIDITAIVKAATDMAKTKTGALIVIQRFDDLTMIAESGIILDAQISVSLIENIFFKNAPLHDGAIVIRDNRIVAGKCVLPSTRSAVPKSYGMRHRAALGMSEVSDAIIVVVSEETGGISIAKESKIERDIPPETLHATLLHALRKADQKPEMNEKL
jgi:uncharacterized protein (TIGR00159 family)